MSLTPEEVEVLARDIASQLEETDYGPLRQVRMIVQHAGEEFARQMLKETLEIYNNGGMLTADGTRQRTKGGIYFYVAKGKLEPSLRQIIFPGYGETVKGASIEWDSRQALVDPIVAERAYGYMTTAPRITLYGRARRIEKHDNSLLMILENALEPVSYARGIPTPPNDPTLFAVYMGKGQYDRIEKTLRRNPKDSIVVEGTLMFDQQTGMIAVFALTVSTRFMEKKMRTGQKNPAVTGNDDETTLVLPPKPNVLPNPKKAEKAERQARKAAREARNQPKSQPAPVTEAPAETVPAPEPQPKPKPAAAKQPTTKQPAAVKTAPPKKAKAAAAAPNASNNPNKARIAQLEQAATTLRERIAAMERAGTPGIAMTRKLLENTERQIAALRERR
jgi:hypothetical protein